MRLRLIDFWCVAVIGLGSGEVCRAEPTDIASLSGKYELVNKPDGHRIRFVVNEGTIKLVGYKRPDDKDWAWLENPAAPLQLKGAIARCEAVPYGRDSLYAIEWDTQRGVARRRCTHKGVTGGADEAVIRRDDWTDKAELVAKVPGRSALSGGEVARAAEIGGSVFAVDASAAAKALADRRAADQQPLNTTAGSGGNLDVKPIAEGVVSAVVVGKVKFTRPDGAEQWVLLGQLPPNEQRLAMNAVGKLREFPELNGHDAPDAKIPKQSDDRLEWKSVTNPIGSDLLSAKKVKDGEWVVHVWGEVFLVKEASCTANRVVLTIREGQTMSLGFYDLQLQGGDHLPQQAGIRVPGAWSAPSPQKRMWNPVGEDAIEGTVAPDLSKKPLEFAQQMKAAGVLRIRTPHDGPRQIEFASLPDHEQAVALADLALWNSARMLRTIEKVPDLDMKLFWEAQLQAALPPEWKQAAVRTKELKRLNELAAAIDQFAKTVDQRKRIFGGRVQPLVPIQDAITTATRFALTKKQNPQECIKAIAEFQERVVKPFLAGDAAGAVTGLGGIGDNNLRLLDELVLSSTWGKGDVGDGSTSSGDVLLWAYDLFLETEKIQLARMRSAFEENGGHRDRP